MQKAKHITRVDIDVRESGGFLMKTLTIIINEEELLENRLEFLQQKFTEPLQVAAQNDPTAQRIARGDVFTFLANADPSPNKKFLQWLIGLYLKGNLKLEDVYKASEYLELFLKHGKKIPGELRDINRYKNINDLYDVVQQYEEVQTKREINRELDAKMHGPEHIDLIYDSPTMKVIQLKSQQAACYFGTNTKWCTAAKRNNQFDSYAKQGPIFVVLVKKENVRFQLHYESNQFMDEKDRRVNMLELGQKYPELKKALGPLFNKAVVTQDPSKVFDLENPEDEVVEAAFYRKPALLMTVPNPTEPMMRGAIKKNPKAITYLLDEKIDIPQDLLDYAVKMDFTLVRRIPGYNTMYAEAEVMNDEPEEYPSLLEQYQQEGLSNMVIMRASDAGDRVGLPLYGFNEENKLFHIGTYADKYGSEDNVEYWPNRHGFIEDWIGEKSTAAFASSVLNGLGESIDLYELPSDAITTVLDELPDYRNAIGQYIDREIIHDPESGQLVMDEYEDFDPTDVSDIIEFLRNGSDEGEDISSALRDAAYSGFEQGIEAEMANDFHRWFDNLEHNSPISAEVVEGRGVLVYVDADTAIQILSDALENDDVPDIADWQEIAEFDRFDEPYYGWNGFSPEAAGDRLYEEMPEGISKYLDKRVLEPF